MKNIKRVLAVVLAVLMLASLMAACGGNDSGTTTKAAETKAAETTKAAEAETTKAAEAETTEAAEEEYQFPEGAELTIWAPGISYNAQVGISTRNEVLCYQILEEKTGVHINWIEPASGTESEAFAMNVTWSQNNDGAYILPNLALTAEEGDEWASIMGDVDTAMAEWTTKFITGQKDIDAEWDTYIKTLKGMDAERAIEIYQASWDRYMSRPVK